MSRAKTLFCLTLLTGLLGSACAAEADEPLRFSVKRQKFQVRFVPTDRGGGVVRAELWLSRDKGATWRTFGKMDDVRARIKRRGNKKIYFPCTAEGDGDYWLRIRTRDSAGHWSEKPPAKGAKPMLIVTVDTTPPVLTLTRPARDMAVIGGKKLYLVWHTSDAHRAEEAVRIDFRWRRADGWKALGARHPSSGRTALPLPFADHATAEVRLRAVDRLGNQTTVTRKLRIQTVPPDEAAPERIEEKMGRDAVRTTARPVRDPGPKVISLCVKARSLLEESRYDEALSAYLKALVIEPNFVEAIFDAGICHFYAKAYDQAWRQFDRAISLDPKNAGLYYRRGDARFQRNQLKLAVPNLRKALELAGDNHRLKLSCWDLLGEIHRLKRAYREAVEAWERVLQLASPGHPLARVARESIARYKPLIKPRGRE